MYHNGSLIPYKLPHEGLNDFLFIYQNLKTHLSLIGHSMKRFDCHIYLKHCPLQICGMISCFFFFLDLSNVFAHVAPGAFVAVH